MAGSEASPPRTQKGFRRNVALLFSVPVLSWALYDFANTIFSMNIVSRYFSLWVTETNGAPDILYSLAVSVSMFFVLICSPLLGVLIDWQHKKASYVRLFGLISIIGTVILGIFGTTVFAGSQGVTFPLLFGLAIFAICNFMFKSSP